MIDLVLLYLLGLESQSFMTLITLVIFCYLKMISENIGLFQVLSFQKLGFDFNTIHNFVLNNTLPKGSFLSNNYSCSNI